jgi:hypothetical protein
MMLPVFASSSAAPAEHTPFGDELELGGLALVSKADRGPVGLDQTAVSVSRLVLGTGIDAEFLSDMGELFRVHETAVCHHRAQGR